MIYFNKLFIAKLYDCAPNPLIVPLQTGAIKEIDLNLLRAKILLR
jgi:hypothetical protein